ncbi:MAG: ribosome maturation factor RimM [Methylophilaceae bacterium]|nr:ribosome maturation factor RimM [Methylophilaceae bacterium]
MVVMGRVVAPYGIFGWLKIQPDTEALDNLFDYPDWWLGRDDKIKKSPWQKYEVEAVKVHVNILLVKLVGVDDRDAALALKSLQVAVPRDQLPEAGEDEYYWSDLIGLKVSNLQHVDFGLISEVFETGANDVLVVKQADKAQGVQERLIPFTEQVVLQVDLQARTMLVDWDADF